MKYEITKEQIIVLNTDGNKDVRNYIKEWFPAEVFETVLEVGKWYKEQEKFLFCFNGTIAYYSQYGFDYNGNWSNQLGIEESQSYTEATQQQVFEALKNELTALGFVNGVYVNPLLDKRDVVKIDLGFKTSFIPSENEFWMGGYCLFKDGVFAEIIPTITKEEAEKLLNKKIV